MKTKLLLAWRILIAIGMLAIIFFVGLLTYEYTKDQRKNKKREYYTYSSQYSTSYNFEWYKGTVRLKSIETGKYITPAFNDVYNGTIRDTLTVFFEKGKRGFLNIYTGEIVIPAQYEKAWIFSEGLGGVVKDGKLGFIDHKGNTVIPYQFKYLRDNKNQIDFVFKDGYCTVIGENDKHGLIDKSGKWVVEPQYDYINMPVNGYRIVVKGERYGLMDSTFSMILHLEYSWIRINQDGFLVTHDGLQYLLAPDGKTVLQPYVIDSTNELWYQTDRQDTEGNYISKRSDYCVYTIFGSCGLFDIKNNRIVTKAIFGNISAINNNLFECTFTGYQNEGSVLINAKGEIIK